MALPLPPVSSENITPNDLCVGRIVSWKYLRPIDFRGATPTYRKAYGMIISRFNDDITIAIFQEDANRMFNRTHEVSDRFQHIFVFPDPMIRAMYRADCFKEFRKSATVFIQRYSPCILESFPIPKLYIVVNQRGQTGNRPIKRYSPCTVIFPNYREMTLDEYKSSSLRVLHSITHRLTGYMRTLTHQPSVSPPVQRPTEQQTQVKFRLLEIIEREMEESRINEGEYLAMCNLLK